MSSPPALPSFDHDVQILVPVTPTFMRLEDQGRHLVYLSTTSDGRPARASPQPPPSRRMSLTSSFNSSQQPHQLSGPSSTFHDQLDDLHYGGEVSTLSTSQLAPPDTADLVSPEAPPSPSTHTGVGPPCWERLIRNSLTTHERIPLIITVFSNRDEVEAVRCLCGDDARIFIDTIYEARLYISSPKKGFTNFNSNTRVSLIGIG